MTRGLAAGAERFSPDQPESSYLNQWDAGGVPSNGELPGPLAIPSGLLPTAMGISAEFVRCGTPERSGSPPAPIAGIRRRIWVHLLIEAHY